MHLRQSFIALGLLLLHGVFSFIAFITLFLLHVAVEWIIKQFDIEDPIALMVTKGLGYALLGFGALCCTSYLIFESLKYLKQLVKPK